MDSLIHSKGAATRGYRRPSSSTDKSSRAIVRPQSLLCRNVHLSGLAAWLIVLSCCTGSIECLNFTSSGTGAPSAATLPPPTAIPFDLVECLESMSTLSQRVYVCFENPSLFPILKYAENLSKYYCEESFKHDVWNCSHFSLLKEPKISSGDNLVSKEQAYVHAISLAGVALSVAQACSSSYADHNVLCKCPTGVKCLDNLTYAFNVAETFLTKRAESQGLWHTQDLIHRNYAAARQHVESLLDSSDVTCVCHGVSGSCTITTCSSPTLPNFEDVANSLRKAYLSACHVFSRGNSQFTWISNCDRDVTEKDLLYNSHRTWCRPNTNLGSYGTQGRNCSIDQNAPNSCQKLCTACGLGYKEFQVEEEHRCDCKFEFCCRITCQSCRRAVTHYACSP